MNIGITEKEFHTLRARAAMRGFVLHRTDAADGPVAFFAECLGHVYHLPTIERLRAFVCDSQGPKAWGYPRQPSQQVSAR